MYTLNLGNCTPDLYQYVILELFLKDKEKILRPLSLYSDVNIILLRIE